MGSTNVMEWLTVACDATFGREDILLYELHSSVWTIVPGATCWLMIGSNVEAVLCGTTSVKPGAGVCCVSTNPNTHMSVVHGTPTSMMLKTLEERND